MRGAEVFKNFYERLTAIRDYHAKFSGPQADSSVRVTACGCLCELLVTGAVFRFASCITFDPNRCTRCNLQSQSWCFLVKSVLVASWTCSTSMSNSPTSLVFGSYKLCAWRCPPRERPLTLCAVCCRVDYQGFLDKVGDFESFPRKHKNQAYLVYIEGLADYLKDFFRRTSPLVVRDAAAV